MTERPGDYVLSPAVLRSLPHLCQRYAGRGPRYTSYPPATHLRPGEWAEPWVAEIGQTSASALGLGNSGLSLYVHLPFCRTLCFFCACNRVITKDRSGVRPYLDALREDARLYAKVLSPLPLVEQLHLGGGTPNYLSPEELRELAGILSESFGELPRDAERSIELDPRTLSVEQLEVLRDLGFSRLSFGIQDFDPRVQRAVNRVQPFEQVRDLCRAARQLGFNELAFDLIYGLPEQTPESFEATIAQVIELDPERIAIFGYAHVAERARGQRAFTEVSLPTPLERISLLLTALRFLGEAGYRVIGMDHFAKSTDRLSRAFEDGTLHRNFMGYTTGRGTDLLGLGVSSLSMTPGMMVQNHTTLADYERCVGRGDLPIARGYRRTEEDMLRGAIIDSILCRGELRLSELDTRWGERCRLIYEECRRELELFERDELLIHSNDGFQLTALGRLFMRTIAMCFDQYLRGEKPAVDRAIYSAVI